MFVKYYIGTQYNIYSVIFVHLLACDKCKRLNNIMYSQLLYFKTVDAIVVTLFQFARTDITCIVYIHSISQTKKPKNKKTSNK